MSNPSSTPFITPMASSLRSRKRTLPRFSCESARPRITSATVWLPVLPPMVATIGINAASAASWAIEPSNAPTTREAMNAVSRFSPSQVQRLRPLCQIGANRSSSSLRPTWLATA